MPIRLVMDCPDVAAAEVAAGGGGPFVGTGAVGHTDGVRVVLHIDDANLAALRSAIPGSATGYALIEIDAAPSVETVAADERQVALLGVLAEARKVSALAPTLDAAVKDYDATVTPKPDAVIVDGIDVAL